MGDSELGCEQVSREERAEAALEAVCSPALHIQRLID